MVIRRTDQHLERHSSTLRRPCGPPSAANFYGPWGSWELRHFQERLRGGSLCRSMKCTPPAQVTKGEAIHHHSSFELTLLSEHRNTGDLFEKSMKLPLLSLPPPSNVYSRRGFRPAHFESDN